MTIVSKRLAPGDTNAHQLNATPVLAFFAAIWPDEGSGNIRFGDVTRQDGFAPYQFPMVATSGGVIPTYDLSTIYYKLTGASDALCLVYATL